MSAQPYPLPGTESAPSRTIGIAVPIPQPYADELQRWRKELGDPLADAVPPHVTLLPPTLVPLALMPELEQHLSAVARAGQRFTLELGAAESFRPISPVVFVRVADGAERCAELESAVRAGPLKERQLSFEYHPHVTVAHQVDDADLDRGMTELADYSASFSVDSFCLYAHGDDGVWRAERCYVLGSSEVRSV